jgi:superfamily II RNA helicase
MAGRAGRRGVDTSGTVILLPLYEFPNIQDLRSIMLGKPPCITSRFFIDYSFILKIIQSGSMNIKSFVGNSLFKLDNDSLIQNSVSAISELEKKLSKIDVNFDPSTKKIINEFSKLNKLEEEYKKMNMKLNKKQINQKKKLLSKLNKNKVLKNGYKRYKKYLGLQNKIKREEFYLEQSKNYTENESIKAVKILKKLGYIADSKKDIYSLKTQDVKLKGLIAGQINECNPIILTEMIAQGIFDDLFAVEICALLAIFIDDIKHDYLKTQNDVTCSEEVKKRIVKIHKIIEYNVGLEKEVGVENYNYGYWNLYYDYIDPIYNWASGESIINIIEKLDTYEGNFIRNVLKINNIVKDLISLTKIYGNLKILPELEKVEELIVRDIVTVGSLYLNS